jgi:hypothetical protein
MSTTSALTPLVIPTGYTSRTPKTSRPIIRVSMQMPDKKWSDPILFNFDTGATQATDVPLQLMKDFGGPVSTSKRKEQPGKVRIPGFNYNQELDIPVMVQDKAHYDLFRDQPTRYPLMRVRDLMPYMSITYELDQTTLRPNAMGPPPELSTTAGIITMPVLSKRSGAPTSSWTWTRGTMIGSSKTYSGVWLNVNTGDYRFIVPRSYCDKAGFKITSDNISGNNESNGTGTMRWDEGKPVPLTLSNITVTARDDDEDFGRGGDPRCLLGGPNFLKRYKIVMYGQNLAFVPTQQQQQS